MARPSHGPVQPLVETRRSDPMSLLAAARVPCAHQQRPWLRARGVQEAEDAGPQARIILALALWGRAIPVDLQATIRDHFVMWVAVNRSQSAVAVAVLEILDKAQDFKPLQELGAMASPSTSPGS